MADSISRSRYYAPWMLAWPLCQLARLFYRVKARGMENLPEGGGALLLANHLSYVDVVVLQLACPGAIRFVGHEGFLKRSWFYRVVYWLTGTIPVSPENALETTRRVVAALKRGEWVLIFPEGSISRTGQLMEVKAGYQLMAKKAGVPVVPVAHDGLWGSVFSFSEGLLLFKSPRMRRTHVSVVWGKPMVAAEAGPGAVRRALLDLGCEAFEERPQLKRHLGREIVRGLARRPWAVELVDCTAERRPLRAAAILGAAAALSRHLKKTVAERRVGIVLPPGAGSAIANLAVVCAGKVPVNLNFTAGPEAIKASLRMAGVKTVLSADVLRGKLATFPWPEDTRDFRKEMAAMGGKRAVLPWLLAAYVLPNQVYACLLGLPRRGDREEAGLLFTSGSSGEPKGVVLTHRNILANCWQISSTPVLPRSAVMLGCLPIFHSFGFTVGMWYPLLRGCRLVTVPSPLDTRRIIDTIRDEEVSVMVGAPTFLRPVFKKAEPADMRTLQVVVSGAEKMPQELYDMVAEKFHVEVMQGYGLTETTPVSNVNQPNPAAAEGQAPQTAKKLGTVGRMMPGMTARILNPDTKEELSLEETGLIAFRGPNVFGGYLDDEKKTAEAFHDGWFVTGDLGRFDAEGFLTIEGRLSRFSKIGGEMVPHGTIEMKLVELFDLDQVEGYALAVVGVPDAAKGESLVMLSARDELTVEAVRERLTEAGFPNLWVPKVIKRVEKIPMLGSGKLDLKGCKEMAAKEGV